MSQFLPIFVILFSFAIPTFAADLTVDDSPVEPWEWGYRPLENATSMRTPPPFAWRPQDNAATYTLQVASDESFENIAYAAEQIEFTIHCPTQPLAPGKWHWRYRFTDEQGEVSNWSKVRNFTVAEDAVTFTLPPRDELMARIPQTHPRLFVRPEDMSNLRKLAQGRLSEQYQQLIKTCDELVANPPDTKEPAKYREGIEWHSKERKELWWGNRVYTIKLLNGAATLGFTYQLNGNEQYGQLARKLLMAAAKWDPDGSTNWKYNDEAAMPYNYYFARTYTFINNLLTEKEREACRALMRIRGEHMYKHLNPAHILRPRGSHNNRSWHFLGEVAIAFHGEIPEADDWLWFSMNVFANVYPVWADDDGGWHEGLSYWRSYINRFTWWADVMKAATGIDAFKLPYFSKAGYYAMYLQPPNTLGAGFGDMNGWQKPYKSRELMTTLATQAGNEHWQWYVNAIGGEQPASGYIGFIRGAQPAVKATPPTDLPKSILFEGIGQAVLNTDITDATNNVQVIFKSSPFGTISHGYESQNSFILYAHGDRLLIRSGKRDNYGSPHHKQWMWHTRSQNNITVNGKGQYPHSESAQGKITAFHTSDRFDYVEGDASTAYETDVKQYKRGILFIKPNLIIIHDRIKTETPSTFQYWLHAPVPMTCENQSAITINNEKASCTTSILAPQNLDLTYTDQFDPPPGDWVDLTEYHLSAGTTEPTSETTFVTVIRVKKTGDEKLHSHQIHEVPGGYQLLASTENGQVGVLLRSDDEAETVGDLWKMNGDIMVEINEDGQVVNQFVSGGKIVE